MFLRRLSLNFSGVFTAGTGLNPASSLNVCRTSSKLVLWNYPSITGSKCNFSTSAFLKNHKKVGHYLFGRPPKPNLNVEQSTSLVAVEDLDPVSREALEKLYEAEFPKDIFKVCQEYKPYLTEIHISRALQQLANVWDLGQENVPMATDSRNALVTVEPVFRDLCHSCLREAQHMDDSSFLLSLRALLRMNVPENSALIHTLLSHSQYRMNQMSSANLAILCQVLNSLKLSSELSQALHKALVLLIPKMIPKADKVWQLVAFMETAAVKLSSVHRGKILHKLLALVKLDPFVTAQDCFSVLLALRSSNFQSAQLVKETCNHLEKCFQDLSDTQLCELFRVLGHFQYLDVHLMEELCKFVSQSYDNFNDESFSKVFKGLSAAKFVHRELAKAGCRYVVETSSDKDLGVELSLIASIARYCFELNMKPEGLENFLKHAESVCENYFQQEVISPGPATFHALDVAFISCLFSEHSNSKQLFESNAIRCLQLFEHEGSYVQNLMLKIALLHHLRDALTCESSQSILEANLELSLPNPWQGTQSTNIALERKLVLKEAERWAVGRQLKINVEVHQGLKTDILILPSRENGLSNSHPHPAGSIAINILPKEGRAVNETDHLVGLYHLKDRVLKHLGYQTLWVDVSVLTRTDVEGRKTPDENGPSYLRKILEKI